MCLSLGPPRLHMHASCALPTNFPHPHEAKPGLQPRDTHPTTQSASPLNPPPPHLRLRSAQQQSLGRGDYLEGKLKLRESTKAVHLHYWLVASAVSMLRRLVLTFAFSVASAAKQVPSQPYRCELRCSSACSANDERHHEWSVMNRATIVVC